MQGIYSYIRKTNNGFRIHNVAVAQWLGVWYGAFDAIPPR